MNVLRNTKLSYTKGVFLLRYPVAVKTPKNLAGTEIHEFLEEAKSMLEIKEYHDNIVNLQGITYTKGQNDNYSIEVS